MNKMTVSQLSKLGGLARAKKLNAEQKSTIGKKGAEARWGKRGRKDGNKTERCGEILEEGK